MQQPQLQFNFLTHSLESPVSHSLNLWSHSLQSWAFIHSNSDGLSFPAGPQRAQEQERARISLFWYGQLPDVDRQIIQIERAIWAHALNYSYSIRLQTTEKKTQEERLWEIVKICFMLLSMQVDIVQFSRIFFFQWFMTQALVFDNSVFTYS